MEPVTHRTDCKSECKLVHPVPGDTWSSHLYDIEGSIYFRRLFFGGLVFLWAAFRAA
jgi:hypothetical protein